MKEKLRKFQIRYNVHSISENERWRLITDGDEKLVKDIVISGHTYTTMDWMEDLQQFKWHVSCEGYVTIRDNVAYVVTVKEDSALKRHVLKTISYRLLGTFATIVTAYLLGVSLEMSSLIGIGEIMIKPILYFFHERIWYKFIKIGRK